MSVDQQSNPNEAAEEFFENVYPAIASTSPSGGDKKSIVEEDYLFPGGLDDLDTWIKHEEFRLKKINSASERTLRERNAKLAFQFAKYWAIFIAIFILMHGFNGIDLCKSNFFFNISDTEFMFVCGTLTASILIFYLNVIRNLFPNKTEDKPSTESKDS